MKHPGLLATTAALLTLIQGAMPAAGAEQSLFSYDANGQLTNVSAVTALPPAITHPPRDAGGSPGAGAALSVLAQGTGPLGYQWFFHGAALPDATNSTLFFTSLSLSHTGLYTVAVFNGAGAVTSAPPARIFIDSDYDELPDDWELASFGNLTSQNADGDADGDTVSNRDEYADGTNPASSSSRFFRLQVSGPGGQWLVSPVRARYPPGATVTLTALPEAPLRFTGWAGDWSGTNNPEGVTMDQDRSIRALFALVSLGEALDAPEQDWRTGGQGYWLGQTNMSQDGVDAAQSGQIGDSQLTWLEVTNVQSAEGIGRFWWKASSEGGADFLRFFVNGTEQPGRISGDIDWQQAAFYFPAGTNVLRWTYSKDGSSFDGADAGWVDQVRFTALPDPQVDADGDQLPDQWEWRHFGSLAPGGAGDFDGDGVNNLDELLEGTNPASSASLFPRLTVNIMGGGTVQRSPDLPKYNPGQWVTLTATPDGSNAFAGWSGSLSGLANPATLVMNSSKSVTARFVLPFDLGAAVEQPALDWRTGGDALWLVQSNVTHDGADAAESGAINHGRQTWMEVTHVTAGDGIVRFWWKVSSEGGYDLLRFYVNDAEQPGRISGTVDWQQKVFFLPAGTNALRWTYSKDGSVALGADAAWVDEVQFTEYPDPLVDADGDQLPDLWEWRYFASLGPGGAGDFDGDGVSNLDEFLEGTNPASNASLLPRLTVTVVGNGAVNPAPNLPKYTNGQIVTLTAIPGSNATFNGWSGALSGSANPAVLTMNASKSVTARFTTLGSLGAALDAPALVWTTGGNGLWNGQLEVSHDGVDSAQSGPIADNGQSWLETIVPGPGALNFWWKVSSESGYDFLLFSIDGAEQPGGISGEIGWEPRTFHLPPGSHALRWTYTKDSSADDGADAGWVDQVAYSVPTFALRSPALSAGGQFQFLLTGTNGLTLVVEASTNLSDWVPLSTNQLIGSESIFSGSLSTNHPLRFYRAVLAP